MNIAVILAGGRGQRLKSDVPKQFIKIDGKMIISFSVEKFIKNNNIEKLYIVSDKFYHEDIKKQMEIYFKDYIYKFCGFSSPGKNRQLSIYNCLEDIYKNCSDDDIVIIADAARPFVSESTIENCIAEAKIHDGAMPALAMKDTVYISENKKEITGIINREKLYRGQAPEAFKIKKYLEANRALLPDKILDITGSTEAALLYGMDVKMIEGDWNNFKITTIEDLYEFKKRIGVF